jgi:endonuclease/exonuclease/phosphatase family metal-dependent hydrolase
MVDSLSEAFPDYDRLGSGRMADGSDEHVAVFVDRSRFVILKQGQFWISPEPDVPGSKGWDTIFPRICTWCVVADRSDGTRLAVFNLHLDNRRVEARRAAAAIVRERMLQVQGNAGDDLPFVVCGDFNAFPDSQEVRAFCADPEPRAIALAGCEDVTQGTFHGFRGVPRSGPIDYVLTGPEVHVRSRSVDARPYRSTWPSDHFPVIVDLEVPTPV